MALPFDMVDFPLSKSMACETKKFLKVFGDKLKCFEIGVHQLDGCFFERRFQIFLSIAALKVGLSSLNDIAISFAEVFEFI